MPVLDITQFACALSLAPNRPAIGLDVGSGAVGVALSDVTRTLASPSHLLHRGKFVALSQEIWNFAKRENACAIVIGLPLQMDGSSGPKCQSVRTFALNLLKDGDIPILFWDERLSTKAVTRTLLEADLSRARRAELVDKMAAAYILQGALDALKGDFKNRF